MISIIILTFNEELNLLNCLNSVKWSDDIHVLDSGSSDKTIDIAIQFGAKVSRNPFESFGKQRNFALKNLDLFNEWILFLDADEVVSDKFRSDIFDAVRRADCDVAGFYCCWKMILEDMWLKRSDNFPKWQFRLMRKGRAEFTDFGHGQKEYNVIGRIDYVKEPYLHFGFSKGWYYWIERHNRYSNLEAVARLNASSTLTDVFNRHISIRNIALKSLLSRIPGWPVMRFLYTYIIKLGFLEGVPGLIYCANIGYYEFLIQIKMREIKKLKTKNRINMFLRDFTK